jgi:energy-coupling factor transporter ATP-binding protein EcfA2
MTNDRVVKRMPIESVFFRNFLVFRGTFTVDFCPGVNVLIGSNATGKTTLLKCLYGACDPHDSPRTSKYFSAVGFQGSGYDVRIDRSGENGVKFPQVEIVVKVSPSDDGTAIGDESTAAKATPRFRTSPAFVMEGGTNPNRREAGRDLTIAGKAVMIPATEMLTRSKGLMAMRREMKMPFDKVEIDVLAKAESPETQEIKPNALKTIDKIKSIIGGEVVYENDYFFIQMKNGSKAQFSLVPGGHKKLGLLWKLLRNGALEKGSVLIWDEPENSLNPELYSPVVDVLLELSRNGVQVFLATHSEFFANYFSVNKIDDEDKVMFYSLYQDSGTIKVNFNDRYDLLAPNKLAEESVIIYEKELDKGFGHE